MCIITDFWPLACYFLQYSFYLRLRHILLPTYVFGLPLTWINVKLVRFSFVTEFVLALRFCIIKLWPKVSYICIVNPWKGLVYYQARLLLSLHLSCFAVKSENERGRRLLGLQFLSETIRFYYDPAAQRNIPGPTAGTKGVFLLRTLASKHHPHHQILR